MSWIKQAVAVLQLALSLVPNVIELVKVIETPGNGPTKAKTIVEFVVAAFDILPEEVRGWIGADKIESFAKRVVETIVAYLNATGIFKKS